MTREEKIKIIENVVAAKKEIEETIELAEAIFGDCTESKFSVYQCEVFDRTIEIATIALNDRRISDQTWLEWFIWENDCGEKSMEAGVLSQGN